MTRIAETFKQLRLNREKALIPYIMAGDPSLEMTKKLVLSLVKAGADIIELGVPFSDPIADGPVIQRAAYRALRRNVSLRQILSLVRDLRLQTEIPLVLMTYCNPVFRMGVEPFIKKAASVGIDGVIFPDLPPEEAETLCSLSNQYKLDTIFLAAPTSSVSRIRKIVQLTLGFVYYVSLTGVTGAGLHGIEEINSRIRAIKRLTRKPVAVGFGISSPHEAALLSKSADGVIVGSSLVRLIEESSSAAETLSKVSRFTRQIKKAIT